MCLRLWKAKASEKLGVVSAINIGISSSACEFLCPSRLVIAKQRRWSTMKHWKRSSLIFRRLNALLRNAIYLSTSITLNVSTRPSVKVTSVTRPTREQTANLVQSRSCPNDRNLFSKKKNNHHRSHSQLLFCLPTTINSSRANSTELKARYEVFRSCWKSSFDRAMVSMVGLETRRRDAAVVLQLTRSRSRHQTKLMSNE